MPKQVDAIGRRALICDAVIDVAASEGFSAVTIRRVAAHMGTSTTAITHYFPSRSELIREATSQALERFAVLLEDAISPEEGIEALVAFAVFASHDAPEPLRAFWRSTVKDATTDVRVHHALAQFDARWERQLDEVVQRVIDEVHATNGKVLTDAVNVIISGIVSLTAEEAPLGVMRSRKEISSLARFMLDATLAHLPKRSAGKPDSTVSHVTGQTARPHESRDSTSDTST